VGPARIVQPEYMKNTGSMCFTELWSQKNNKRFFYLMKEKTKQVKVYKKAREIESVYRPEKWKEEERIKAKIQINHYEKRLNELLQNSPPMGNSFISQSKGNAVEVLPPLKPDLKQSGIQLSTKASFNIPTFSSTVRPRTKTYRGIQDTYQNEINLRNVYENHRKGSL